MPGNVEEKVTLSKNETKRLQTRADAWPTLTRKVRDREREAFVTEFLDGRGQDNACVYRRDSICNRITQWFSNHTAHNSNNTNSLIQTRWTARQVFNETESEDVTKKQHELREKATAEGTTMRDIVALNKARMIVWNELSAQKQAEYGEEAERWTAEGPDPMSRLDVIEKRMPDWVDSMAALLWDQAGVMAHITLCHLDADGQIVETTYDISDSWHRKDKKNLQFTKVYPHWQRDFPASFVRFCRPVLRPQDNYRDEEAVLPKQKAKWEPIALEVYPEGDPILPPITDLPDIQPPRQDALRRFLNAHYALARGVSGIPVPWNTLSTNNDKFLTAHSKTKDILLQDPSKLSATPLGNVWGHIVALQKLGDPAKRFRFAKWYDTETEEYFDAKYAGPPAPKKAPAAKKKGRGAIPPSSNPWHADRVDKVPDGREADVVGARAPQAAPAGPPARRRQPAPAQRNPERQVASSAAGRSSTNATDPSQNERKNGRKRSGPKPGRSLQDKGKGRARNDSDSAISSQDEEQPSEPIMGSDDSPDEFDFDAVGGLLGRDSSDDDEAVSTGPSHALSKNSPEPSRLAPQGTSRRVRDDGAMNRLPSPRKDLWAIENVASIPPQPSSQLVSQGTNQPPCWVDHVKDRVFAFLWGLAGEGEYRKLLTGWRHMLDRRASFKEAPIGEWANWDYEGYALPAVIHEDVETWQRFLQWIHDAAPLANASASEVQRWMLMVGMALRDTHVRNEIEDDGQGAIRDDWPEYIRYTPADFKTDVLANLEPFLATVYRPLSAHNDTNAIAQPRPPKPRARGPIARKQPSGQSSLMTPEAATGAAKRKGPPGIPVDAMKTATLQAASDVARPQSSGQNGAHSTLPSQARSTARNDKARRGPPGLPATTFQISSENVHHGTRDGSHSAAEVEAAIGMPNRRSAIPGTSASDPKSISEGLALAKGTARRGRHTPVPIVLIESTVADRIKRRRRGVDIEEQQDAPPKTPAAGDEGAARPNTRASKRRRLH